MGIFFLASGRSLAGNRKKIRSSGPFYGVLLPFVMPRPPPQKKRGEKNNPRVDCDFVLQLWGGGE